MRIALYLPPVALALLPAAIYLVAPDFYGRFVLNDQMREYQAVEMVTFACGVVGGVLLVIATWQHWKDRPAADYGPDGLRGVPDRWGALTLVGASALAALFFAGEEVNWGQTFAHWGVAEREQQREITLNLHNTTEVISLQGLGSAFILIVFVVVPVVWALREKLNLPAAWRRAVPIGPAVLAIVLGLGLSEVKDLYARAIDDSAADRHYVAYFEQLNEQKEMLFALAMLLYGYGALRKPEPDAANAPPTPGIPGTRPPAA